MKNYNICVNGNYYQVSVEEANGVAVAPVITPVAAPIAPIVAPTSVAVPTVALTQAVAPTPVVATGAQGNISIKAPMPGKIVDIKVSVGSAVKKGQVIVILEAMKMENEIVSSEDGVVASINVNAGGNVESGDLIATLN